MTEEDSELLRRYAENHSEAAFAELVQRRIGLVYAVALRTTRNAHRAEDVTQTVFADLARKAASLADRPVLAGWLYRSAHFAALGVVRAEQNRAAREREAQIMHETLGSDEPDQDWGKIRPLLDQIMSELEERDRDAIMLRYFDNRPFAEIGARLQLTENSARMHVERSLDKLHALLGRRGIRSTTAALAAGLAQQALATAPAGLATTVTGSALASAKMAAPAVSVLQFMSTSKIATTTVGLVLVLGFGMAGYEVYAEREADAAALAALRDNEALRAKLAAQRRQTEAAYLAAADLRKSIDEARAAAAAQQQRTAQAAAAKRAAQAAQIAETEAFMARHPEVRRAAIEHWRAQTAGAYGPLFKSLGLTPAQIAQFIDLASQGITGITDGPNGEPMFYSLGGDGAEARKQLRAMLGEDGYRRYREFTDSGVRAWQSTNELAAALFDTPTPLTPKQGENIFRILTEGRVATPTSPLREYDWAAIMPKAERILSEPQLATLGIFRTADEYNQAAGQVRRSRTATSAPTKPAVLGK